MKTLGIVIVLVGIVIVMSAWYFLDQGYHVVQVVVPYVVGMAFIMSGLAVSSGKRNRRDDV